jgi:hypothetical protein
MHTDPQHVAPADPRKRRRTTRVVLGVAVVATLGASGILIANANADETAVPGRLQAEAYTAQSGAQTEGTSDTDGGKDVGWLAGGDWLEYKAVAVTGKALTARVASQNTAGGSIELHLGTQTGTLLATFPIASTGNWQKWTTVTATAKSVPAGPQTVFAVMKSASKSDFVNLNWFTLGPAAATTPSGSSSPSASASATATPSASATASAPAAGYVPVDQAAYQKELAAFDAIKPLAVPAGTTRVPEFHTDCDVSGSAPDDPIVFPNMPGASHDHTFFGPHVDAASTGATLLAETTTCTSPGDNSAYWVPTLLKDGKPVPMKNFRAYYGSRLKDPSKVTPFPPGLVMVQGDAKRQVATPAGAAGQFWCAGSAEIGRSADGNWPVCAAGGNLIFQLTFQDCWDGKNVDSPDHKSHMGPAVDGACTGAYPVAVPDISLMVNYDSLGGDGLALSSGMASSMHGDFMNAWTPANLSALVKICIDADAKCGDTPTFTTG